jgi:hypothetical protein
MTMHVVLGDGEMTRKELTETLSDIWKADEEAGQTFWFLIQGKSEPNDTDKNLVSWLERNEVYYEIITDDKTTVDAIYSQPQEVHEAKRLGLKVVNLLKGKPEEEESAELLALFASDDPGAPEDQWLNDVCQAVFDADFPIRALNDGLVDVDMGEPEPEPEAEPEEPAAAKTPAKKALAKKAAAQPKAADTKVSAEDDTPATKQQAAYTRDQLEDMELDQLKAIAGELGFSLPARTRMTTYVEAILGEDKKTPVAEVSAAAVGEPATLNGSLDIEALADAIVLNVIKRLEAALS